MRLQLPLLSPDQLAWVHGGDGSATTGSTGTASGSSSSNNVLATRHDTQKNSIGNIR